MIFLFTIIAVNAKESFQTQQQKYPRVRTARKNIEKKIQMISTKADVDYPPEKILLRAFKSERVLEIWAKDSKNIGYKLIVSYDFTGFSGDLGPKRSEGDYQIPEGIYYIDRFNPASQFHLSLGLNYPNKSDRIRTTYKDPGCDIFIHGNQVTIGCIPLGDLIIEQLYIIAVDTKSSVQKKIPVHIFPYKFKNKAKKKRYLRYTNNNSKVTVLWKELESIYNNFDKNKSLPDISINNSGAYLIKE